MSREEINTCDICGSEVKYEHYSDYTCKICGQEFIYDNDCYRIELTKAQIEILRRYAYGDIL